MRELRLISEAIESFKLNLRGITVLTEAASGNYVWTPIIAALAGARVFAFTRDSKYATFEMVRQITHELCERLGVAERVTILEALHKDIIRQADIITNLGFLRPLNSEKLQLCKQICVIPLMYETWEYRPSDIDLEYCIQRQIPVLGTNEDDPRLQTVAYLAEVVKKVLFIHNIEVFKAKVVILGRGKFSQAIKQGLEKETDFVEIWADAVSVNDRLLRGLDAIIIADHETDTLYIGDNGVLEAGFLRKQNPDLLIIHIAGRICEKTVDEFGLQLFPKDIMPKGYMSLRTDFVGPKPVIDLHTAGLKVGEIMYNNFLLTKSYEKCIELSKKDPLVQAF